MVFHVHRWDRCICEKCGKTRHKWEHEDDPVAWIDSGEERCKRCGELRPKDEPETVSAVQRERAEAKAQAKRERAEAKAQAKRERAEAKAQAERENAETNNSVEYSDNPAGYDGWGWPDDD